ncbi:MAG: AI-2E family transporter [Deltaproteobacteria bacterium]
MSDNEVENNQKPEPDIGKLGKLFNGTLSVRSLSISGLFILAVLYTLYVARAIFIPISFAILLSLLLAPAVNALKKIRIPEELGAAVVLILLLGILSASVYVFYQPATEWLQKAPQSFTKVEQKLRVIKEPVEKVSEATKSVEKITEVEAEPLGSTVEVKRESLMDVLISQTWEFAFGVATMIILLYFLLASGDLFLRKVINILPKLNDKKRAVEIARHIESHISNYLYTIVTINIFLGAAVGGALYLLKMPNPFLWGIMAGLLNFVLYLGPTVGIIIVAIVASATFDNFYQVLLPPLAYFIINGLEGNFITPMILGRRLLLNPVVIFLALLFWGWIWGIPGALIAVPIVVIIKIICDNVESLAAIGEFLGK